MSKLTDLVELAKGWRDQEGGEAGHIGTWIIDGVVESAEYDGLSEEETVELVKSSLEEIKNVCDYATKELEE